MRSKRYHFIFDIKNCSHKQIKRDILERILNELPPLIEMKIIAGPVIVDGEEKNPGLSAFVIIDYSHISIHTFSRYDEVLVDVFSCKPYDPKIVTKFLLNVLEVNKNDIKIKTVSWG